MLKDTIKLFLDEDIVSRGTYTLNQYITIYSICTYQLETLGKQDLEYPAHQILSNTTHKTCFCRSVHQRNDFGNYKLVQTHTAV